MSIFDAVLIGITVIFIGISMMPKLRTNIWWRATVTPLASIIGSGFLIIAPLLAKVAGSYAVLAMLAIVLLAYAVGHVIRYNIRHSEKLETAGNGSAVLVAMARLADVSLSIAYVISVAFYIRLLASFALSLTPINSGLYEDILATVILLAIGTFGWVRGLRGLEVVETISVSIKLSIIAALLAGLFWHNFGTGIWSADLVADDGDIWLRLRMLGGMLLVVQGFETSRYLGQTYPADMRRKTMKWAQISTGIIYLAFVALIVPLLALLPAGGADETAIIGLTGRVTFVLPYLLVLAALMSQLSAGIADTVGAGGLLVEETGGRIVERAAYPALIFFAIILIWMFDIFEVISIASRTFAFYYLMQAAITAKVARDNRHFGQMIFALILMCVLGLIVIFAVPVE
ncbi:MAG: hypothetical protein JKY31_06185 [Rhodobacteraceae bacterium]|nr:hypothetical protein [Paracoccaceae bacterium]